MSARPAFSCHLTVACAALGLALGNPVRADPDGGELPTRLQRPNALRAAALAQFPGVFTGRLGDGYLGLTYARQLGRAVAVEITGGRGNGGSRNGAHLGGGVRLSLVGDGAHALTTDLGGHAAFLPDFGTVYFSHVEMAWEMRTTGGFDLVLGGGVGMTLSSSSRVDRSCGVIGWFGCPDDRFHAGDAGLWTRLELGWAF